MKLTYIRISIDTFSYGYSHVHIYSKINGEEAEIQNYWTKDILPYLIESWKLVKRGGKRTFCNHEEDNKIFTREVILTEWS